MQTGYFLLYFGVKSLAVREGCTFSGLSTQESNQRASFSFFMKWLKQTQAATHIRELLQQRGLDIPSHRLTLPDSQQWTIFEYKGRQLGVDTASGIWIRESEFHEWRCISMPCTVSGALQAVEFLVKTAK